jgi:TetR/AcrR family transcriptional repressor of nem operon
MARPRAFDPQAVIDQAMLVFWQKGYEATSIRDLKGQMGISSSSMYELFGDKRGVYLAALARSCELERAQMASMAHSAPTPQAFIQNLFEASDQAMQAGSSRAGSMALHAMVEFGLRDPDITQLLLAHYFAIAEVIARVIDQGQRAALVASAEDPHLLAYTLLTTLYGVVTLKGIKPDFADSGAIARVILTLLNPTNP